jgi:hypothetical protein
MTEIAPPEATAGLAPPVHQRLLPWLTGALTSAVTAAIAFLAAGVLIVATTGKAPWGVYRAVFQGAGLDWFLPWISGAERTTAAFNLQQTLLVATPLVLTGLARSWSARRGRGSSARSTSGSPSPPRPLRARPGPRSPVCSAPPSARTR